MTAKSKKFRKKVTDAPANVVKFTRLPKMSSAHLGR